MSRPIRQDGDGVSAPLHPIAIYGVGGHGREVWALIQALRTSREARSFVAWVDDAAGVAEDGFKGAPVCVGLASLLARYPVVEVVLAVGSITARARLADLLATYGVNSPTLIHPHAWVGVDVDIGAGTQVGAGAVLSTDIRIGRHVIVNHGSTIAHDVVVEDFVNLAPGVRLSGAVHVERGAEIGTAASIIQGVRIGTGAIVGAGAVVLRDVAPHSTVVGVPARVVTPRVDE